MWHRKLWESRERYGLPTQKIHPQNWNDIRMTLMDPFLKLVFELLVKDCWLILVKEYGIVVLWRKMKMICVHPTRLMGFLLSGTRIFGFHACVARKSMPLSCHVFFYFQIINFDSRNGHWVILICSCLEDWDMLCIHYNFSSYFLFRKPSENSSWWSRAPCCNVNTFSMA